jgi:hypothetical protein
MKMCGRSGGIAPRILNLGARWRWAVSFMIRPLYPWIKSDRYQSDSRQDPGACLGTAVGNFILEITDTRPVTCTSCFIKSGLRHWQIWKHWKHVLEASRNEVSVTMFESHQVLFSRPTRTLLLVLGHLDPPDSLGPQPSSDDRHNFDSRAEVQGAFEWRLQHGSKLHAPLLYSYQVAWNILEVMAVVVKFIVIHGVVYIWFLDSWFLTLQFWSSKLTYIQTNGFQPKLF